ncbi:MAG: hypothetical protein NVS3B19_13260 [Ginsengibacter sp.]
MQNLCDTLNKYPGRLILDVRSVPEFTETGMPGMTGANLGHFKEAVNISIQQLDGRLMEIEEYKDKPVFVICSHSQRSRRASVLLAKNGFTHIYNINAGLSGLHQLSPSENPCLYDMLTTVTKYQLMSPVAYCQFIQSGKAPFVLDVRPDSSFMYNSSSIEENSYGTLKGAKHIALNNLANHLNELPKDKMILLTDVSNDQAEPAALLLNSNGFSNVAILTGGVERMATMDSKTLPCLNAIYTPVSPYKIIGSADFGNLYPMLSSGLLLDIRSSDDFKNMSKDSWRNGGHIKGAVNVPFEDLSYQLPAYSQYKKKPVLVYGFSGDKNSYSAAKMLTDNGFTNVYLLGRGLFDIRWTAHNIKGNSSLAELVTDVPTDGL